MDNLTQNKVLYVYIDESFLRVNNKLHILIGAYALPDPLRVSLWLEDKLIECGISSHFEIKWNMKGVSQEVRERISRLVLETSHIAFNRFFLSMVETDAPHLKSEPFVFFLEQLTDWAKADDIKAIYLMIDQGLLPHIESAEKQIRTSLEQADIRLLGIQFINSQYDRALQVTDVRLGMMKWIIDAALKDKKSKVEYDFNGVGDMVDMDLANFILLSARDSYWGKFVIKEDMPHTQIAGHGFRVKSSLPKNLRKTILQSLDCVYIGCTY